MTLLFLFASFSPCYSSTMLQLSTSYTITWGRPLLQVPILALKSEAEAKRGHTGHSHRQSPPLPSILSSSCSSPGQELLPPPPTCNTATFLELTTIALWGRNGSSGSSIFLFSKYLFYWNIMVTCDQQDKVASSPKVLLETYPKGRQICPSKIR